MKRIGYALVCGLLGTVLGLCGGLRAGWWIGKE